MATVELTEDNFEVTINQNDIVLVDFWADWCAPVSYTHLTLPTNREV